MQFWISFLALFQNTILLWVGHLSGWHMRSTNCTSALTSVSSHTLSNDRESRAIGSCSLLVVSLRRGRVDGLLGVRNCPALCCNERGGVCMTNLRDGLLLLNGSYGEKDTGVERGCWGQSIANYFRYVPLHWEPMRRTSNNQSNSTDPLCHMLV